MTASAERSTDLASQRQVDMLASLLDHRDPPWGAGMFPPLGHWVLFPPLARQSTIGIDGHPVVGSAALSSDIKLSSEIALPRRMWAGSRIKFLHEIPIGSLVERETHLLSATPKEGRSGHMLFVTLRHRLSVLGAVAIEEDQDIVYREAAIPGVSAAPPPVLVRAECPAISDLVTPDPVKLFRYSALTYNAHRIHYDRDYATKVEGYPALVVHGPYIATLLMDFFLKNQSVSGMCGAAVGGFDFRALRPVFDTDPFTLGLTEHEHGADLVAIDMAGGVAMSAQVMIRPQT